MGIPKARKSMEFKFPFLAKKGGVILGSLVQIETIVSAFKARDKGMSSKEYLAGLDHAIDEISKAIETCKYTEEEVSKIKKHITNRRKLFLELSERKAKRQSKRAE